MDLNIWWHLLQVIVFLCPACFIIFKVFENKLRVSKRRYWTAMSVYIVIITSILGLTMTEVSPYREFGADGIYIIIILTILIMAGLIKESIFSLLFVVFIFINVELNIILLAFSTTDYHLIPQIFSYEYADMIAVSILYGMIMFPVVYYLLVKLYKRIVDADLSFRRVNLFFLLPAGFFTAVFTLTSYYITSVDHVTKDFLFPLLCINICAFASYFAALESIVASHDAALERERLYTANTQLILWQEQYEHLQGNIMVDAKVRHDWKHHLVTVLGYVNKNDMLGLREYLSDYQEKYLSADELPMCNIRSLDILFQYYKRKAMDSEIRLSIPSVLLEKCEVDILDLTIIFGNLLENAMEACERVQKSERYISLKVGNKDSNLIAIICENSFDGIVNRSNNKIISRKENGGIGLASIESITQKHRGSIRTEIAERKFTIYVSLQ